MSWTEETTERDAPQPVVAQPQPPAPLSGTLPQQGASTAGRTAQPPKRGFGEEYRHSLTFFLADPRWFAKLWVLPVFFWVPVVNLFSWWLLKAWQVCTVQSIARGEGLPNLNYSDILGNTFKRFLIAFTNFLFPVMIFWATGLSGPLDWWEDIQLIWNLEGWEFLKNFIQELIIVFVVTYIWTAISSCIIQSGIIRWTISGNWTKALNPVGNLLFFLRHLHYFAKFYVYYLLTLLLMTVVTMMLSVTVVGLLLWPVLTCWYATSVAHELGHLAQKVAAKQGIVIP